MKEIDKLRQRLGNISRNAVEYRMTIQEAKSLLEEFAELEKKLKEQPQQIEVVRTEPTVITRTIDGGTF